MNLRETRRYEMLVRVRDFGGQHAEAFPEASLGGQMFAAIAQTVTELTGHAVSQVSGRSTAREMTTSKGAAREALLDTLEVVSRTARALALATPGLEDKFRMPRGQGEVAILSAARAVAQDAKPLAKDFISHGLPETFLDELAADIAEFEQAIRDHSNGRETHVSARAGIDRALDTGFEAVRHLDAIVPNILRDDPAALAAWDTARHIERLPHLSRNEPVPAPAPPSPSPIPSSAAALSSI